MNANDVSVSFQRYFEKNNRKILVSFMLQYRFKNKGYK